MRFIAIIALILAAAVPARAYQLNIDGVLASRIIPITDIVPAPETVIDMAGGERTSIDAHPGKVRIVTMWATWCHVCELEMPILAEVKARYEGRDLMIMPVSLDEPPALELIAEHLARHDLTTLPVMHDRHFAMAGRIGVVGTPTTIIVDKYDQVVARLKKRLLRL